MATETTGLTAWLWEHGADHAFSTLAELMPDAGVFAVDENRRIIYWSPGAEKLLGFKAEEVLGDYCLKSSRCEQCMKGCGISEHGEIGGIPIEMFRADGSTIRVRKWGRSFKDPQGRFQGGIEILLPDLENPVKPAADPGAIHFHGLITRDRRMHEALAIVRNVAPTDVPVLVRGESGSGKELIARAIHEESHRRDKPFLAINCAALTPSLLESELFGHEKGAFTGAVREHKGLFERADGGTLFLDEVAELPAELQAKLLRVLQEQTFYRVGGTNPISVNVRIVSATHRSLRKMVDEGTFRADLMYRLRVVPIYLPPLRERREDVPLLIHHFVDEFNQRGGRRIERIAPEAMRMLLDYGWPGNIRELKNVLEYVFAVGRGSELKAADLPPEFHAPPAQPAASSAGTALAPGKLATSIRDEASAIREALSTAGGNVGQAAELLGMSRPTFWRKRKKYGI